MDVEGAEDELMLHLGRKYAAALCAVDLLAVEWHSRGKRGLIQSVRFPPGMPQQGVGSLAWLAGVCGPLGLKAPLLLPWV